MNSAWEASNLYSAQTQTCAPYIRLRSVGRHAAAAGGSDVLGFGLKEQ